MKRTYIPDSLARKNRTYIAASIKTTPKRKSMKPLIDSMTDSLAEINFDPLMNEYIEKGKIKKAKSSFPRRGRMNTLNLSEGEPI